MDLDTKQLLKNLGHCGVLFLMGSAGWEVAVLRSSCQNSGSISLARMECQGELCSARGWGWAAPQLSCKSLPGEPPGSCAAQGLLTTVRAGDVMCSEKGRKAHLGAKQAGDKQLFSSWGCWEGAKAILKIIINVIIFITAVSLCADRSIFDRFLLCFALTCLPICIILMS